MASMYSLRTQQLAAPNPLQFRAAEERERGVLAQMTQPGANQMIGYRFAAEQDRIGEGQSYNLALDAHNEQLGRMRVEDRENAVSDREDQQAHAVQATVLNNPAGASASSVESIRALLRPQVIEQFDALRQAQINQRNRAGTSSGTSNAGQVTDRNRFMADEVHNRGVDRGIAQAIARRDAATRAAGNLFGANNQREAINRANEAAQAEIARLEGTRRRQQAAGQAPPQAVPQQGAGAAQPAPQAAPDAAATRLSQARDALTRGAPRERVEAILRQQGIDPGAL